MSRLLNIGCGAAYHPEWLNLDAQPGSPAVMAHDARRALPIGDESLDAVYASHVLEHLAAEDGARLLRECHRVLAGGGILRIVVPDLEEIVRLYLHCLEGALGGDTDAAARYEWAMLELYDQVVRTESGGNMSRYLRRTLDERQRAFVAARIGDEAAAPPPGARPGLGRRLAHRMSRLRFALAGAAAGLLLGAQGRDALREGVFRRGGEVHLWMYDRYSLRRALEQAGFADVRVCAAEESRIDGFARYGLETRAGLERKPDSLYVEALRPRPT
jgi:predicted SAM-dependent methyltransferase